MGVQATKQREHGRKEPENRSADLLERLEWLDEACEAMSRNNPAKAREYAAEALRLSLSLKHVGWIATAYVRFADCARLLSEYECAAENLKRAEDLLEGTDGYDVAKARLFRSLGKMSSDHRGDTRSAIEWYNRALEKARRCNDPREIAQCLLRLGESYLNTGARGRSAALLAECLELSDTASIEQERATALVMLGLINTDLGQYALAEEQITTSLNLYKRLGDLGGEARAMELLAYWHVQTNRLQDARDLYHRAVRLFERKGDRLQRALALMNMGHLYAVLADRRRALECLDEVIAYGEAGGNPVIGAMGLVGRGENLAADNDVAGAIVAYEKALVIMKHAGLVPQEFRVVGLLAQAHEQAGNIRESLVLYKRFMELDRELLSLEICRNILRVPYDRKMREAQRRAEERRGQADQMEEEVVNRSRELESIAEHIARNDMLLTSLRDRLLAMKSGNDGMAPVLQNVIRQIDNNAQRADVWRAFAERLETVDEKFAHILLARFPELTPAELRVCTLLRLSMSNREIATLLNLSRRTVESHRLGIRRKLGLAGQDDLVSALEQVQDCR